MKNIFQKTKFLLTKSKTMSTRSNFRKNKDWLKFEKEVKVIK